MADVQHYMTAKLNLADGTIVYPQVSLDNIVAAIDNPTLVTVVTKTGETISISDIPTAGTVASGDSLHVPTGGAVYTAVNNAYTTLNNAINTKQATLVEGDNIIHIINGSTIMADITNLDVAGIDQTATNGVHLVLDGNTVSAAADLAANDSAGVIAGASDGVQLVDGVAQFDIATVDKADGTSQGVVIGVGDGLLADEGVASIDEATVEQVLQGGVATWTEGESGWSQSVVLADDKVNTPANLRGALSVGQAVDVSTNSNQSNFAQINFADVAAVDYADHWETLTADMLKGDYWLTGGFGLRNTSSSGNNTYSWYPFPKAAKNLRYLIIFDVLNQSGAEIKADGNGLNNVQWYFAADNNWRRVTAVLDITTDPPVNRTVQFRRTSGTGLLQIYIKNWRQYEVTALTDDAIAYIASLPDPDQFFRGSSIFQIRDKYLVKQDMVCPWIYTIPMSDNSDLTVGAGLSYKIKYTNDNPHNVTVDTIPADAYGLDAHIQMFIKGTSGAVFQSPLVLMNPLTPNAGNNLVVKFRNGQALVYVEDTNAGYVVLTATGTTDGTLAYGLTMAPASNTDDKYIIFSPAVDGVTCDFGTVTPVYGTEANTINVIGNGSDMTTVTGTLAVPGNKYAVFQDLAVVDGVFNGLGYVVLSNSTISGDSVITGGRLHLENKATVVAGSTLSTTSGNESIQLLDAVVAGTVYSPAGFVMNLANDYNIDGNNTGVLTYGVNGAMETHAKHTITLSNIEISGCTGSGEGVLYSSYWGKFVCNNVVFKNDTSVNQIVNCSRYSTLPQTSIPPVVMEFNNCLFEDNTASRAISVNAFGTVSISGCTFGDGQGIYGPTDNAAIGPRSLLRISGYNKAKSWMAGDLIGTKTRWLRIETAPDTTMDLTGNTTASGKALWTPNSSITVGDNFTMVTPDGLTTRVVDGLVFDLMTLDGKLSITSGNMVVKGSTANPWRAQNALLASPIDANPVDVMQITGSTFTEAAKINVLPARIQLPKDTTVYFTGNTNATNTKILQAPVILVGDGSASDSASVVTATGTTAYSGIGSYIDKEGDSDFIPLSSVVEADASSLQTAVAGSTKFIHLAAGSSASIAASTTITDKVIMASDYTPVFAGSITLDASSTITIKIAEDASGNLDWENTEIRTTGVFKPSATARVCGTLYVSQFGDGGSNTALFGIPGKTKVVVSAGNYLANSANINRTFKNIDFTTSVNAGISTLFSLGSYQVFENCTFKNIYADWILSEGNGPWNESYARNCYFEDPISASGNKFCCGLSAGTIVVDGCTVLGKIAVAAGYCGCIHLMNRCKLNKNIGTANTSVRGWVNIDSSVVLDVTDSTVDKVIYPVGQNASVEDLVAVQYPGFRMLTASGEVYVAAGLYQYITKAGVAYPSTGAAYITTSDTGTASGSLYYGLVTSTNSVVMFSKEILTSPITLSATGDLGDKTKNIIGTDTYTPVVDGVLNNISGKVAFLTLSNTSGTPVNGALSVYCGSDVVLSYLKCTGGTGTGSFIVAPAGSTLTLGRVEFNVINCESAIKTEGTSASPVGLYITNMRFLGVNSVGEKGLCYFVGLGAYGSRTDSYIDGTTFSSYSGSRAFTMRGGALTLWRCTLNAPVVFEEDANLPSAVLTLSGDGAGMTLTSTITGNGTVTFANNTIMTFTNNANSAVISGGTIVIPPNVKVTIKPYGGGSNVTLNGGVSGLTGTSLSNTGVLS